MSTRSTMNTTFLRTNIFKMTSQNTIHEYSNYWYELVLSFIKKLFLNYMP